MTSFPSIDVSQRRKLRRELRARRRGLSPLEQQRAALGLTRQLLQHPQVQRSRHIGLYLPNDGEIDPGHFIQVAHRLGKSCYLPVLHPVYENRLWFFRFDQNSRLLPNRFGIPEPPRNQRQRRPARALDLVLMPLVGFDVEGGRLGMGGGFYDRTFAFRLSRQGSESGAGPGRRSPWLIGLAHECQKVPRLPLAPWDVPLDAVVTDREVYSFGTDPHAQSATTEGRPRLFFGRYQVRQPRKGQRRRG